MTMGDLKNKLNINLIKATAFFAILAVLMIAASLAVKPRYGEVYDISKTNRKHIDLKDEKTNIDVVFSKLNCFFNIGDCQVTSTQTLVYSR